MSPCDTPQSSTTPGASPATPEPHPAPSRRAAMRSRDGHGRGASALVGLRELASLAGSATARTKAVAAVGLVTGVVAALSLPQADPAVAGGTDLATARASSASSALLLAGRDDAAGRASRSDARTAIAGAAGAAAPAGGQAAAVAAPTQAAPVRTMTFGVGGVTAVAKPTPKPKPKPVETTTGDSGTAGAAASSARTSGSSDTGSSASGSSGSAGASAPVGGGSCPASGLTAAARFVCASVNAQFGISTIGGYRPGDGDHGEGRAVDVMTSGAQGDAVAAYIQANAGRFNVEYVIWQQRIWFPGSGWRAMADRGSPTANHMDHVHITVR